MKSLGVSCCYLGESCHLLQQVCGADTGILRTPRLCHCLQRIPGALPNSCSSRGITFSVSFCFCSQVFGHQHKPTQNMQRFFFFFFIVMASILLSGGYFIIHKLTSLQHAQLFPGIRHSVFCHRRRCLTVSPLLYNLCCEEGLPLLHLVQSSVSVD